MKILLVLIVSVSALLLGGCAERPLLTDEEYDARHPPASHSPDYTRTLPQPSKQPPGW